MSFGDDTFSRQSFSAANVPYVSSSVFYSYWAWNLFGETSAMFKNVAGRVTLLAVDTATNLPKTGDAANITAYVKIDGGAVTQLGDTSAAEEDATNAPGLYTFTVAQSESNGDALVFSAKSSTSGVRIVPRVVSTIPSSGIASQASVTDLGTRIPDALTGNGMMKSDMLYVNGTGQSNGDINLKLDLKATQTSVDAVKDDTAAIKLITDDITFTVAGAVNVNVTSWLGFVVEVDAQNYPFIGSVNTKTGYALTSAYDAAKTAAQADTALSNLVWTNTKASHLDAPVSAASAPSAAAVADAVCDELLADHVIAGSLARGIASAGAAGDPLSSPVPGSYTVGQAGYALALIGTGNTFAPVVGRIGATGEVVDSDTIVAYHYGPVEVNPIVVLDSNNDPVDMSVYSGNLAFIVFSVDETGVETNIVRLSGSNVVVGGDNDNEITLSGTTALTGTVGRFRYALRVTTTNNKLVRLQGDFIVKACANTA